MRISRVGAVVLGAAALSAQAQGSGRSTVQEIER